MNDPEAFSAACGFVMPFGKYEGKTLARIGASREGLLYLDWLIGHAWVRGELKGALDTYLGHPAIAQQVSAYLEE